MLPALAFAPWPLFDSVLSLFLCLSVLILLSGSCNPSWPAVRTCGKQPDKPMHDHPRPKGALVLVVMLCEPGTQLKLLSRQSVWTRALSRGLLVLQAARLLDPQVGMGLSGNVA